MSKPKRIISPEVLHPLFLLSASGTTGCPRRKVTVGFSLPCWVPSTRRPVHPFHSIPLPVPHPCATLQPEGSLLQGESDRAPLLFKTVPDFSFPLEKSPISDQELLTWAPCTVSFFVITPLLTCSPLYWLSCPRLGRLPFSHPHSTLLSRRWVS